MIEFECPRCLNKNRVQSEKAGQRIDCPNCNGSLLVPSNTTGQGLFDDIFESKSGDPNPSSHVEPLTVDESTEATHPEELSPDDSEPGLVVESDDDLLSGISNLIDKPALDDVNPLEGDDPFKVDPDAPLKIDGIDDIFGHADVYGFRCKICETRIHVRPDQAGTHVECPECYSQLLVEPPPKNPKPAQLWVKEGRDKKPKTESDEDELKLSDPIDRPKVEIDESFGLEAPSKDLLAPKPKSIPPSGEDYGLEIIEDDEDAPIPSQPNSHEKVAQEPVLPKSKKSSAGPGAQAPQKSRRERYEESQRRLAAEEAGVTYDPEDSSDLSDETDFPEVEFGSLLGAAFDMVKTPGVICRVSIAITLMCFGAIAMESIYPASTPPAVDGEGGTMTERLLQSGSWMVVGAVPYLLGLLMLWFTCGYIFRDAALGHRNVESWKNAGTSELSATFLIFSFGFFIGGLPALFVIWLAMPLSVLLGPLFLLGAWYDRSPFSIISVDAFKNFTKETWLWGAFYRFMAFLAFLGFVGGLMFKVRGIEGFPFAASVILTVLAVLISVAVTLIFAAVCGWHCGRVVEGLRDPT